MKYLILPTDEADTLNYAKAVEKGAQWEGAKAWAAYTSKDGLFQALQIPDNEVNEGMVCVDALPNEFNIKLGIEHEEE